MCWKTAANGGHCQKGMVNGARYMRFNRWSENGTIQKVFEKMQEMNIIDIRTDVLCIDSTSIKVHPDASGARKSCGTQSIGRSKGG